jgi:PhoPQ-activated pathogenicity-related protein
MAALVAAVAWFAAPEARADLPEYIATPDESFSWSVEKTEETPAGKIHRLKLTSQTWRGIPWTHQFRIYEPTTYTHKDVMLLFITGGSSTSRPKASDDEQAFLMARACDARVAVLPQVPNQPLLGDRVEDDLISETFVNFLKTGEKDWPLLQPMVKSAVRAMDAAQAWAKEAGEPVEKFVVTGASKRGWTTWLTGASDPRVAAIAPMVIPTLNMKEQTRHQKEVWGFYSEQIEDYTRRGLTETFDTPDGARLWKLVDPYFYVDKIAIPKLQINGTNDRYWSLDSMNLYWGDLVGPSYAVYLPNAGHGLDQNREFAIRGVGALLRHVAQGKEMPKVEWKSAVEGDSVSFELASDPAPKAVRLWVARDDDLDFRDAEWKVEGEAAVAAGACQEGPVKLSAAKDGKKYIAALLDMTYEIDGMEYHLSSQIRQSAEVTVP